MAEAFNLVAKPERTPQMFEGEIHRTVTGVSDSAYVVVPSFSREHLFGPCPWEPRVDALGNAVLPSKGDLALVTTSNEGRSWIVSWTPYE